MSAIHLIRCDQCGRERAPFERYDWRRPKDPPRFEPGSWLILKQAGEDDERAAHLCSAECLRDYGQRRIDDREQMLREAAEWHEQQALASPAT